MKVKELGTFKAVHDEYYNRWKFVPEPFNIEGRQLWLKLVQYDKKHNDINFPYKCWEYWNLIFAINNGDGQCSGTSNTENRYFILQMLREAYSIRKGGRTKDIIEVLKPYPIICIEYVIEAMEHTCQFFWYNDLDIEY